MSCLDLQLPQKWCKVCQTKNNLSKCGGCKVIFYCSREHQAAHRKEHKKACQGVVAAREKLARAKEDLASRPPHNVFEDSEVVGHFHALPFTRPYMQELLETAMTTVQVPTPLAMEEAVDHLMEMLRLNRGDNMAARMRLPNFLLRLGRDQECYDFIKYWRMHQLGPACDPEQEGFLGLKDEDMFEPIDLWNSQPVDLSHAVSLTLIKIRLLFNLKELSDIIMVNVGRIANPLEIPRISEIISPWVLKRTDIMTQLDQGPLIGKIFKQIEQCYKIVDAANEHFWPALLNPHDPRLYQTPGPYSLGSFAEARMIWQYNYACWAETPAADDAIRAFRRKQTRQGTSTASSVAP